MVTRWIVVPALAAALGVAGCAETEKVEDYKEEPVERLYNEALDQLHEGDYKAAAKSFDEVERQHPYSVWATKGQLMAAYAHYEADQYDEAIIAANRFIELHPGNRDIAYAYYLRALSYYEQISDIERDQKMTEEALLALEEVVRRFPDSDYARDTRLKIDLARDHLAGKEMEIGRFYQTKGHYLAAINRYQTVIEQFQTTTHAPEALHRLVESYLALGLKQEARRTAAVLGYNYPGSEWYVDSYALLENAGIRAELGMTEEESSWWNPF